MPIYGERKEQNKAPPWLHDTKMWLLSFFPTQRHTFRDTRSDTHPLLVSHMIDPQQKLFPHDRPPAEAKVLTSLGRSSARYLTSLVLFPHDRTQPKPSSN